MIQLPIDNGFEAHGAEFFVTRKLYSKSNEILNNFWTINRTNVLWVTQNP